MPNIIQHKRSSTSGVVPVATGLSQGELAINIADGRLYTKNNANVIINLGVTSISGTSITPASGNFTENINIASQTTSTIAGFDASKNITSLSTATYPSLTELSYVKGTTSAIQTQINNKQNTLTNPVTGTGTNGKLPKWNSSSALTDSILSESSTVINIAGSLNGQSDDSYLSFDANTRRIGITKKGGFTGKFTYGSGVSFAIAQSNVGTIEATNTFTDRLVINSIGNVGVGTDTPQSKVHITDTNNLNTTIEYTNTTVGFASGVRPLKLLLTASNGVAVGAGVGIDFVTKSSSTEYTGARIISNRTDTSNNHALTFWAGGGTTSLSEYMRISSNGNVGIGTTTPSYKLQVNGSFAASTKSFRIHHPSKKDHSLEYGSLESPYHGVRLTGRDKVIKGVGAVSLPDYLKDLIHDDDTLNIQITNIKHGKTIYIDKIDLQNDRFIVKADRAKSLGELQFFWTLSGVRKDVDHLVVEKRN
jgi:hypothetical protein